MRRLRLCHIVPALALVAALSACEPPGRSGAASDLAELDRAISRAALFRARRQRSIDSIAARLSSSASEADWRTAVDVALRYRTLNADSAIKYAQLAMLRVPPGDSAARAECASVHVRTLSAAGFFTQAQAQFDSLIHQPMSPELRRHVWLAGRELNSYIAAYAQGSEEQERRARQRYRVCDDSLLSLLPPTSDSARFIRAERFVADGNYAAARPILDSLLHSLPREANLYGMAAFQMAETYRDTPDDPRYTAFLARAATSDITGGVSEGLALPLLAEHQYAQGNLDAAFTYINSSLAAAMSGAARMRTASIARLAPLIDGAYRSQISSSHSSLLIFICLLTVSLLICAGLLAVVLRQRKRSARANVRLHATTRRLEAYVGHFLAMCASYAERLDTMTNVVGRKISAGQTDELLKLVKSGRFSEGSNEEIFRQFDAAILDIFPTFVADVNALLRPGEQFDADAPGIPPELRIYAVVRLGVDESARIAKILRYSVNTVYAYRNRVRSRALNRDTFDTDIMRLGAIPTD